MPIPVDPVDQEINPPTYNATGTVTTSGVTTSAATEGPWYIEEQTLSVDYHRVPFGSLSAFDITLSSVSVTETVKSTVLLCEIRASYTSYKDWGTYNTSDWSQPQKFQFIGFSADANGNTYGALTASDLGPMGSIVTTQPYYRRVPWVGPTSGHYEISEQCLGANYWGVEITGHHGTSGAINQTRNNDSYEHWLMRYVHAGSLVGLGDDRMEVPFPFYQIPGAYGTSQENIWKIFEMLDQVGNRIKDEHLLSIPVELSQPDPVGHRRPVYDVGCSNYRIQRHDYS